MLSVLCYIVQPEKLSHTTAQGFILLKIKSSAYIVPLRFEHMDHYAFQLATRGQCIKGKLCQHIAIKNKISFCVQNNLAYFPFMLWWQIEKHGGPLTDYWFELSHLSTYRVTLVSHLQQKIGGGFILVRSIFLPTSSSVYWRLSCAILWWSIGKLNQQCRHLAGWASSSLFIQMPMFRRHIIKLN